MVVVIITMATAITAFMPIITSITTIIIIITTIAIHHHHCRDHRHLHLRH